MVLLMPVEKVWQFLLLHAERTSLNVLLYLQTSSAEQMFLPIKGFPAAVVDPHKWK